MRRASITCTVMYSWNIKSNLLH